MEVKDYYRILGVEREASREEIKRAYRQLAMEYHPDRNQDKPGCEEQLKDINEAYRILGNAEKRRLYDLACRQSFNRQVDYPEDLMEIFSLLSRGGFGMRGFGGCKGMGFGRRGCRRWKETY